MMCALDAFVSDTIEVSIMSPHGHDDPTLRNMLKTLQSEFLLRNVALHVLTPATGRRALLLLYKA